jgi:hypothetical protein
MIVPTANHLRFDAIIAGLFSGSLSNVGILSSQSSYYLTLGALPDSPWKAACIYRLLVITAHRTSNRPG